MKKILVVDDDPVMLLSLQALFEFHGYAVTTAISVNAALEALHDSVLSGEPFAVVITDGLMPERDGIELAKEMGLFGSLSGVHLVMYTGEDEAFRERARQAGVKRTFSKRTGADRLLAYVKRACPAG
jgi:CheY-like chemotaxis protein